mmetsp:Transcript_38857/g.75781  ORF Transcript_38857/g.75781 Transcript_38857/m.75781 type:complete len:208 (+) Transcript_38857:554-1177(+)
MSTCNEYTRGANTSNYYDTRIRVFGTNTENNEEECVAGNDDAGCDLWSKGSTVQFQSVPGVLYAVYVDSSLEDGGKFELEVSCTDAPSAAPTVSPTVSPTATQTKKPTVSPTKTLPVFPDNFKWGFEVPSSDYACLYINDPYDLEPYDAWEYFYFCWEKRYQFPGMRWSYHSEIDNMRCVEVVEFPIFNDWRSDHYLCVPQDSPYHF